MVRTTKITLTIPTALLERVDATAAADYATRSGVIRQAVVDYLRTYERAAGDLPPEEAWKVLQRWRGLAHLRKTLKIDQR